MPVSLAKRPGCPGPDQLRAPVSSPLSPLTSSEPRPETSPRRPTHRDDTRLPDFWSATQHHTDEPLQDTLDLLISVTGTIAAKRYSTPGESRGDAGQAAVKHHIRAWSAPSPVQLPALVSTKNHLSKAGNRYLRIALYMPALGVVHHDPILPQFTPVHHETRPQKIPGRLRHYT